MENNTTHHLLLNWSNFKREFLSTISFTRVFTVVFLKAGFHCTSDGVGVVVGVSSAYDLVKIEDRSRKRCHKVEGIGVGRVTTLPFLPGCRSRKQEKQPITRPGIEHCDWCILPFATPTMQFSLDRKRRSRKRNQCSASNSVGLIFTRSCYSTLLITTPTMTPSLVKTSLILRNHPQFQIRTHSQKPYCLTKWSKSVLYLRPKRIT